MWLVGGTYRYGYNVQVWLVGVVVRRYIDILTIIINFPYSTCISSFFGSSIPTSLFINPRRACTERVTVVVSCVCMYVCMCVCMSVRRRYSGSTCD